MMIRRGAHTGRIEQFSQQDQPDGPIICQACTRIVISSVNLGDDGTCPFCHNPVDLKLTHDVLDFDPLSDDEDDPPIAIPC